MTSNSFDLAYAISPEDEKTLNIYSMDGYFPKRRYAILLRKRKYLPRHVKTFLSMIKPDISFGE
jgi:hypothetical protein